MTRIKDFYQRSMDERRVRQSIRNTLVAATVEALWTEFVISVQCRDWFRAECVAEIIVDDAA